MVILFLGNCQYLQMLVATLRIEHTTRQYVNPGQETDNYWT